MLTPPIRLVAVRNILFEIEEICCGESFVFLFVIASALNDELRACLINSGMYKSERFFRKTRHFLKAYSAYSEKNNAELRKKIRSFVRFVIF